MSVPIRQGDDVDERIKARMKELDEEFPDHAFLTIIKGPEESLAFVGNMCARCGLDMLTWWIVSDDIKHHEDHADAMAVTTDDLENVKSSVNKRMN